MKNIAAVSLWCLSTLIQAHGLAQIVGKKGDASALPAQWPTYGGDAGGKRYADSAQINLSNVQGLTLAWTFHTGSLKEGAFEATPILFEGSLYLTSPRDKVFALDPANGQQRWSFDPEVHKDRNLGIITSRGVAAWASGSAEGDCSSRIFLGTLDGRLLALDAKTGARCSGFGKAGSVDLTQDVNYREGEVYEVTSPPTVVGDVVIVGSGLDDNARVDTERGDVRGFDARTGALRWTWEPMPWANQQAVRTGAANVWGVMAADVERGLIYLPVSSPSLDYYGGTRPGNNQDADSIVALDAATGRKVWAYQIVHHDLWDYDLAAEPLLFTFRGTVPAVAVGTKMGQIFVFNRVTGEPLYPIEERRVPQSDVPGEVASPTEPYSSLPMLSPSLLDLSKPLGIDAADDAACRALLKGLRYDGMYTPASERGSILFPSNVGGINWGSMALDPQTGILYANTNREPYFVRLRRRPLLDEQQELRLFKIVCLLAAFALVVLAGRKGGRKSVALALLCLVATGYMARKLENRLRAKLEGTAFLDLGGTYAAHFGMEIGMDKGSKFMLYRQPIQVHSRPCAPMPWGTVSAINLNTGKSAWETPLGTMFEGAQTGTLSVGGPIVTKGGLVFTAASEQAYLRAFNATSGEEVWKAKLPAPAQSTPMSYMVGGRQMVVVAAGGHPGMSEGYSDSLVAYALDENTEDQKSEKQR